MCFSIKRLTVKIYIIVAKAYLQLGPECWSYVYVNKTFQLDYLSRHWNRYLKKKPFWISPSYRMTLRKTLAKACFWDILWICSGRLGYKLKSRCFTDLKHYTRPILLFFFIGHIYWMNSVQWCRWVDCSTYCRCSTYSLYLPVLKHTCVLSNLWESRAHSCCLYVCLIYC